MQRQLTKDLVVGAAYVGTFSQRPALCPRHQLPGGQRHRDQLLERTFSHGGPTHCSALCYELQSDQKASYHGLQITSAMRMNHHVTFNAFYTFSKTNSSAQLYNSTTQGLAQNYSKLWRRVWRRRY